MDKWTKVENLTAFLVRSTGSSMGHFIGRMSAKDQRALFGEYLGRGQVEIDGERETLGHLVSVCFGTDSEYNYFKNWRDL